MLKCVVVTNYSVHVCIILSFQVVRFIVLFLAMLNA